MTLNQLKYFQAVARSENFRAAAEELYISQPSLSRSIDSLEKELGVLLFEKSGAGLQLQRAEDFFWSILTVSLKNAISLNSK